MAYSMEAIESKKMEEKAESKSIHSAELLPLHILEIIFSKLPIFYLPFCRLVCKAWNDAVLGCASSSTFTPNPSIIVCAATQEDWRHPKIHSIDLRGSNNFVASLGSHSDWSGIKIANSCNGLLCFSKRVDAFKTYAGVLNLMTNEYRQLLLTCGKNYYYGLGFCLTTKRYKIARAPPCSSIVEIFTFGSENNHNQWSRCIYDDESTSFAMIFSNGVYFDGALYWVGQNRKMENVVCRLDIEQEKLEAISLPQVGNCSNLAVGVFSGNVYVSFSQIPCYIFQVWIMGRDRSWVKNFVVDGMPRNWTFRRQRIGRLQLIKVCEDGEILCVVYGLYFFMYNPETRRIRILNNQNETGRKASLIYLIESFNFGSLQKLLSGDE